MKSDYYKKLKIVAYFLGFSFALGIGAKYSVLRGYCSILLSYLLCSRCSSLYISILEDFVFNILMKGLKTKLSDHWKLLFSVVVWRPGISGYNLKTVLTWCNIVSSHFLLNYPLICWSIFAYILHQTIDEILWS